MLALNFTGNRLDGMKIGFFLLICFTPQCLRPGEGCDPTLRSRCPLKRLPAPRWLARLVRWSASAKSAAGSSRLPLCQPGRDRGGQVERSCLAGAGARLGSDRDDPTIIRHLHDLAALQAVVADTGIFNSLVTRAFADDSGRVALPGPGRRHPSLPCSRSCRAILAGQWNMSAMCSRYPLPRRARFRVLPRL